jgi:hypothetical protein
VLPTTNAIDTLSSSNASDTELMTIEGHTVVGTGADAVFTFVTQQATLTGQTVVTLGTPLARVSRMYIASTVATVGDVYVFEAGGTVTAGVPQTAADIHLKMLIGDTQSFKAQTTFDNDTYAIITNIYASVAKKTAAIADIQFMVKTPGGVFRPKLEFSAHQTSGMVLFNLNPCIVIPKNTDVRLDCNVSANNTQVNGGFQAYLASTTT